MRLLNQAVRAGDECINSSVPVPDGQAIQAAEPQYSHQQQASNLKRFQGAMRRWSTNWGRL